MPTASRGHSGWAKVPHSPQKRPPHRPQRASPSAHATHRCRLAVAVNKAKTIMPLGGKRPVLGDNVFVAPSASVIGDVKLGQGASVSRQALRWVQAEQRGGEQDPSNGKSALLQVMKADAAQHWGCSDRTAHLRAELLARLLLKLGCVASVADVQGVQVAVN